MDSLIRDKIVTGIRSKIVRERLLPNGKLTLDEAIETCRAHEVTTQQMTKIQRTEENAVNVIHNKKNDREFNCRRCLTRHGRKSCPAYNKQCQNCGKTGHVQEVCRLNKHKTEKSKHNPNKKGKREKKVKTVEISDNSDSDSDRDSDSDSEGTSYYVQSLSEYNENSVNKIKSDSEELWKEILHIGKSSVEVKLDTGADCNVLSKLLAKQLKAEIKPSKTKKLVSFSGHKIPVIGEIEVVCRTKRRMETTIFKVVEENFNPILGKHSCQQLLTDY